jgi:hypothetical protein
MRISQDGIITMSGGSVLQDMENPVLSPMPVSAASPKTANDEMPKDVVALSFLTLYWILTEYRFILPYGGLPCVLSVPGHSKDVLECLQYLCL